jgi:hypothetical protein
MLSNAKKEILKVYFCDRMRNVIRMLKLEASWAKRILMMQLFIFQKRDENEN